MHATDSAEDLLSLPAVACHCAPTPRWRMIQDSEDEWSGSQALAPTVVDESGGVESQLESAEDEEGTTHTDSRAGEEEE